MSNIESYVFFDIETTGLPWQEKNQTKITELSFVVASRKDIIVTQQNTLPPVSKLSVVFNPERPIHPEVVKMNGLTNNLLRHAPVFRQKIDTLITFLKELPKPVCFVAHNGNKFDYKILLAEFNDANIHLPEDLLCVDSLVGFRNILDNTNGKKVTLAKPPPILTAESQDLLTDDEDEWPDLNLSTEEWNDIDKICNSFSDISCEDLTETKKVFVKKQNGKKQANQSEAIERVFKANNDCKTISYTLISIYKRLLNKTPHNHHRAEDDCFMLLECVLAVKDQFILWADSAAKKLTEVNPLIRQ